MLKTILRAGWMYALILVVFMAGLFFGGESVRVAAQQVPEAVARDVHGLLLVDGAGDPLIRLRVIREHMDACHPPADLSLITLDDTVMIPAVPQTPADLRQEAADLLARADRIEQRHQLYQRCHDSERELRALLK